MTDDTYTSPPLSESYSPMRTNAAKPVRRYESKPGRMDLGLHDDAQPTVWDAVGYPHEDQFTFETFWLRYERQSEARAIIDKPVNDTWQERPTIQDESAEDQDEPTTEFEEQVEELFEGEHTRRQPVHRLSTGDKLGRIGHYSLIVLGFGDGRDLSQPVQGVAEDEEPEFDGLDDIHYIATFGEDRVVDMEIDTDMTSPRYRLPETIEVITQEAEDQDDSGHSVEHETEEIHWTRFIHVPEGTLEDDLSGTPALKPVFHELVNIDKIKAASGEGYWRGGYQGLVITPPENPRGERMEFSDDGEAVQKEIDRFLNNYERTMRTTGNVDSIDVSVSDPTPHLEVNYRGIEVAIDIPRSVFVGEDRADTADRQAASSWHSTIAQRRIDHAEPVIMEPFIQRLIDVGILPEPSGDGFSVEWPPLDELTEEEEADVQNTKAQAMRRASPSNDPTHHWTTEEIRAEFGFHPERGKEVDEEYWPDEDEMEEDGMAVDEQALQEFQERAEEQPPPAQPGQQQPGGQQPPAQPDGGEEQ